MSQLYEFLAGPCIYITLILCFAGLVRKTMIIISGRRQGMRFLLPHTRKYVLTYTADDETVDPLVSSVSFAGRDPFLALTSIIFHISIIAAPFSAAAHGILFDQAWFLMPPRFNPSITGMFTMTAIVSGLFLLLRRILVQHVAAVSSWKDYSAMICVLTPFVTGFLARKLIGPYEIVMLIHCISAHVLLVATGWTRLGHMIFFTTGLFITSDMNREIPV